MALYCQDITRPQVTVISRTLPKHAEIFMKGMLMDVNSQPWRTHKEDLQEFQTLKMEKVQHIIKSTIEMYIQENNKQQGRKVFSAVLTLLGIF